MQILASDSLALPGLHAFVVERVCELLPVSATVLDIAAGTGALTQRLLEMGYSVVANDVNSTQWQLDDVPLMNVDLNTAFAPYFASVQVDCILAIEVIEHLENPRAFLRECAKVVSPSGFFIVTTPNVTSTRSRVIFGRSGHMAMFNPELYYSWGHISILPWWLLEEHAKSTGWQVVEHSFGGNYDFAGKAAWPKRLVNCILGIVGQYLGCYSSRMEHTGGCSVFTLKACS